MNLNPQELITLTIALGGFIGTLALLVLNLRVSAAMSEMRTGVGLDLKNLELQMARMRTDAATDRAALYEKIMETMARTFVNRDMAAEQHQQNVRRMDEMKDEIKQLTSRVADIS